VKLKEKLTHAPIINHKMLCWR